MFEIVALPAFADNYLWLLHRNGRAAIVDPGDAQVVQAALDAKQLVLDAILLTHHHADHTGGVGALVDRYGCRVVGPRAETIAYVTEPVVEGDTPELFDCEFAVLEVPGHTAGHIAYDVAQRGVVFCGDTLFAAGCGRLFEGTPAQMWNSLGKLARLPKETEVYCAHEYTLSNLRFARAADPSNAALIEREAHEQSRRARGEATVPFALALEIDTNPFLRAARPELMQHAAQLENDPSISGQIGDVASMSDEVRSFAVLRAWKNIFR